MHLHQVLTGAVNPGDCCYSVGSVNDVPFTVRFDFFHLFTHDDTDGANDRRASAS